MTCNCWEDRREFYDDWDLPAGTCLLPDGHDGPHEFTDDSDIIIQFVSLDE
jgi:hypothetical protein